MTRVLNYGNEANYDTKNSARKAWSVYRRLLGYALRYKFGLVIVLFFSLIVAGSFTTTIFSVGAGLSLLYEDEGDFNEQIAAYAERIRDSTVDANGQVAFWAPANADARFVEFANGLRDDKSYGLAVICGVLVGLTALGGVARFLQEYFAGAIGADISVALNREMFGNIVRQSHRFFEDKTTGEVVARFTNDAFMVNKGLAGVFVKVFREPIKAIFFLAAALSINAVLTGVVLLVLPPVAFVIQRVGRRVKKAARRSLQKVAAMASVIHETVAGIAVIKSFRMEAYEVGRVEQEVQKLRGHLVGMARADAAIGPTTEFLMVLGLAAFILVSQGLMNSGTLTPGELLMLFGFLAAMLDPLRKLATVNNMVQTSVASAERVFEFIDMEPEVTEKPGAVTLPALRETLAFENVRFAYDGKTEVLRGLDFFVRKGEMVALVGFSGSGKSTAVKLIPRFYDPIGGRITLDGVDLRDATLASLRDQISLVTQDTILFHESIRGNIAYGRVDLGDDRVREAARAAHADEFIEKLPNGYDEILGEGGGNLSGGQRQRLAIARAIVKDPSIIILDEATSSLDSESERAIQMAMAEFVVGRTAIVIAHRLSTIRRADRIVVINEGRVAEEGTHDELLARGGIYRRLYEVQFAAGTGPTAA